MVVNHNLVQEMDDDAEHDGVHQRLLLERAAFRERKDDARGEKEEEEHQEQGASDVPHLFLYIEAFIFF